MSFQPAPVAPSPYVPLAEVVRSGFVEGLHTGAAVVLDPDGLPVGALGDIDAPILPRSAAKPLQSVAMVRAGLDLPADLLALATASHSGEPRHLAGVERILAAGDIPVDRLANTPDRPLGRAERVAWARRDEPPTSLAQNCSGQHAAMLLTCRTRGWRLEGYLDPEHPLQREVAATLAYLTGGQPGPVATDGCGSPTWALTLRGLARAFARIASADRGSPEGRVGFAVSAHGDLLGGSGREVTRLIAAVPGLVAKDGAEGVFAAALPGGDAVALKVGDGGGRAVWPVAAALLRRAGVVADVLDDVAEVPVLGHGQVVGRVRPLPLGPVPTP
jgi:L-asparaginase II